MAVLTDEDYTALKRALRADPAAKAEMRALSPAKQDWMDALQGMEDWWVVNRVNAKAAMETASGLTLTNALAKKLGKVYFARRVLGANGG